MLMIRETSREAYDRIKAEGLLSERRFEVYEITFLHGPGTAGELSQHTHKQNRNNFATRLTELRHQGVVREVGERECKVTGYTAIVWEVTDDLPVPFKRETKAKFLDLTPEELAVLRTLYRKGSPEEQSALTKVMGFVTGRHGMTGGART